MNLSIKNQIIIIIIFYAIFEITLHFYSSQPTQQDDVDVPSFIDIYPSSFPINFNDIIHKQFFFRKLNRPIDQFEFIFEYYRSPKLQISIPSSYYFVDCMIYLLDASRDKDNNILFLIHDSNTTDVEYEETNLMDYLLKQYIKPYKYIYNVRFSNTISQDKRLDGLIELSKMSKAIHFPLYSFYDDKSLFNKCFKYYGTLIYMPGCMPEPIDIFAFLVAGLGGSGTHYVTNLLRSLDLDVLHEIFGDYATVGWIFSINNVAFNITYPQHVENKFTLWDQRFQESMQLVRCPMKQISAITSHSKESFQFILNHARHSLELMNTTKVVPKWLLYLNSRKSILFNSPIACDIGNSCKLPIATISHIYWTMMINETSSLGIHRIENIENLVESLCGVVPTRDFQSDLYLKSQCSVYLKASKVQRQYLLNKASNRTSQAFELYAASVLKDFLRKNLSKHVISQNLPPKYEPNYFPVDESLVGDIDEQIALVQKKKSDMLHKKWNLGYNFPTLTHKLHDKITHKDLSIINSQLASDVSAFSASLKYLHPDDC